MIPFPNKKYQIIYADPPWRYDYCRSHKREIENYYPTMTLDSICKLPIGKLSAKDSILFMWITFPKLNWLFPILSVWGFEYKTVSFVWVKTNKISDSLFWGMGNYTRSNSEICIIATKGKPLKRISAKVHQIVMSPIGLHSEKPSIVRQKIVELFGDLPRIELFARPPKDRLFEDESYKGWDLWGNEV